MENQKTSSSKQIILNYGVILGLATILVHVINYSIGDIYKPHWTVQASGLVLTIVFIIIGIKKFKESNDGFLTVGQGLKNGVGIALIGGLIAVVYSFIFMSYIEPDFMTNMMEVNQQAALEKNPNLTEEQLEMGAEIAKKFSSPVIVSAFALIWTLFIGFVISLIASFIMKKSQPSEY